MSDDVDRAKLIAAETALIALTDECGGACSYRSRSCLCAEKLWPAIEAIREEIAASVRGT